MHIQTHTDIQASAAKLARHCLKSGEGMPGYVSSMTACLLAMVRPCAQSPATLKQKTN